MTSYLRHTCDACVRLAYRVMFSFSQRLYERNQFATINLDEHSPFARLYDMVSWKDRSDESRAKKLVYAHALWKRVKSHLTEEDNRQFQRMIRILEVDGVGWYSENILRSIIQGLDKRVKIPEPFSYPLSVYFVVVDGTPVVVPDNLVTDPDAVMGDV